MLFIERIKKMVNPYTPGAGSPPSFLAGRDKIIKEANIVFKNFIGGGMAEHTIYYGLRGVGKTVLLNYLEEVAENTGLICKHIEIQENFCFPYEFSMLIKQTLKHLSTKETVKCFVNNFIGVLKAFNATWNPNEQTVSFGLNPDIIEAYGTADSGNFTEDLICLEVRTYSWTVYTANPRLCLYSVGLLYPSDCLIRFELYQLI